MVRRLRDSGLLKNKHPAIGGVFQLVEKPIDFMGQWDVRLLAHASQRKVNQDSKLKRFFSEI